MSLTAWAQEEKAKREAWYENDRLKKRIAELEKLGNEMAIIIADLRAHLKIRG
jgi:hypothetical protein